MDKNVKIKVAVITHDKESKVSKFSIAYSAKKTDDSQVSYEIISTLKAEDKVIIEVNSSLLNLSEKDNKVLISKLTDSLEKMGIEYNSRNISINPKRSILTIPLESKKIKGFELFAYIPNEVWYDIEFRKIIPKVGVRYYILKSSSENNLTAFVTLDEDERLELCSMVIFDHIIFGTMGINTSIYKKDDIINLLNK